MGAHVFDGKLRNIDIGYSGFVNGGSAVFAWAVLGCDHRTTPYRVMK
jgi:hypothetical protein